jgi:hypothetical protein
VIVSYGNFEQKGVMPGRVSEAYTDLVTALKRARALTMELYGEEETEDCRITPDLKNDFIRVRGDVWADFTIGDGLDKYVHSESDEDAWRTLLNLPPRGPKMLNATDSY